MPCDFFDVCRRSQEMDIIQRNSAVLDAKFQEVDHGIELPIDLCDIWVFAEINYCVSNRSLGSRPVVHASVAVMLKTISNIVDLL